MNYFLYIITIILLSVSFFKDKRKTKQSLLKALKSFEKILPQLIGIIILVGIMLAFFNEEYISKVIGNNSGVLGIVISLVVGSITLIPGFVAFPTAAILLNNGAGITQIAAFVSSLMMVGVATYPLEVSYFGRKLTIMRNVFAFLFSIIVALLIGIIVGS